MKLVGKDLTGGYRWGERAAGNGPPEGTAKEPTAPKETPETKPLSCHSVKSSLRQNGAKRGMMPPSPHFPQTKNVWVQQNKSLSDWKPTYLRVLELKKPFATYPDSLIS